MSIAQMRQENQSYEDLVRYEMLRSGHNFIVLILTARKKYKTYEIGGVDVLIPIEYIEKNETVFKFKIGGGTIKFTPDPMRGGYPVCHLLDTPHNRKILATHYNRDEWEIEDDLTDQKIRELKTKIHKGLQEKKDDDFQKKIMDMNNEIVATEDQKKKNELTNKMINLISSKAEKDKPVVEKQRTKFPKPVNFKPPRRNQKKEVSKVVKVDEHE